jgi:AcrR family transcriptional regulator
MALDPKVGPAADGTRQQSATDRTCEKVLDAALACFAELGYGATRIADIHQRSGVSVGSIYHHFGNKEGIAAALHRTCLAEYRDGLLRAMEAAEGAQALVRAGVVWHLDWAAARPQRARFVLNMGREVPLAAAAGDDRMAHAAFVRALFSLLAPYVERGAVVSMPPDLYAAQILGPCLELLRLWLADNSPIDPATARDPLAAAVWRALRGTAAASRTP